MRALSDLTGSLDRRLGGAAAALVARPWLALGLCAALTALSAWYARGLVLKSDLLELLPAEDPAVRDLQEVSARFGGFGYVAVVVRGAAPADLRRFAEALAPRLRALPEVRQVEHRRPRRFIEEHALYYLSLADLETLHDRIAARVRWEKARENPLFVALDDEVPPPVRTDDLVSGLGTLGLDRLAGADGVRGGDGYYIDEARRVLAVFARPSGQSTDLAFAERAVAAVKRTVATLVPASFAPGLTVEFGGTFTKKVDQQALVSRDLGRATLVAVLLILAYLVVHFRRPGATLLLFLPLLSGVIWTFAYARLCFGQLNILTGFIGAILLGLGIDHGIHLLARLEHETRAARFGEAVRHTFAGTGRAVLIASLTTLLAFAGLALSGFRAFREFGVIAAGGILLVSAAFLFMLPALLGVAHRLGWRPAQARRRVFAAKTRFLSRRSGVIAAGFALATFAFLWLSRSSQFNYDTGALAHSELRSFQLDAELDALMGHQSVSVVALARDPAHERAIAEAFRQRSRTRGEQSLIDFVVARGDFVPDDQPRKREILQRMTALLAPVTRESLASRDREHLDRLQRAAKSQPFGFADLPESLRRRFENAQGGGGGSFVLVFSRKDLSDGRAAIALAEEVRDVPLPGGGTVSAAGESLVIADVFTLVEREWPRVMLVTFASVFLALWLLLGSITHASLCLLPPVFTLLATFGGLPLLGLKFDTINVVMIPVLFGVGVDGGVHVFSRVHAARGNITALADTMPAVFAALFTTALGFGSLVLADHSGLNSLGYVALVGLGANALASLLGMPALLAWSHRHPLWRRFLTRRAAEP